MPEPISIKGAFDEMSTLIHEPVEGERQDPENPSVAVDDRVAANWGIPFEDLVRAVAGEQEACLTVLMNAGPMRAFAVAQCAAFLAGVRWEQGRHPDGTEGDDVVVDLMGEGVEAQVNMSEDGPVVDLFVEDECSYARLSPQKAREVAAGLISAANVAEGHK